MARRHSSIKPALKNYFHTGAEIFYQPLKQTSFSKGEDYILFKHTFKQCFIPQGWSWSPGSDLHGNVFQLVTISERTPLPLPNQFFSQDNSAFYDSSHSLQETILLYCFKKPQQSPSARKRISPLTESFIMLFCSSALQQQLMVPSVFKVLAEACFENCHGGGTGGTVRGNQAEVPGTATCSKFSQTSVNNIKLILKPLRMDFSKFLQISLLLLIGDRKISVIQLQCIFLWLLYPKSFWPV